MLSVEWAAPETRLHHRQPFRKQARPILARPVGVNSVEHGAARCARRRLCPLAGGRSEEHTSELQSLMRISYAVFCLKKKKKNTTDEKSTPESKYYQTNNTKIDNIRE